VIYLDTSAFLKLYVREANSGQVQALVTSQKDPLPVWEFQQVEMINALYLKVFWKEITAEDATRLLTLLDQRMRRGQYYCPRIDRAELMMTFRSLAKWTPDTGCRTMDILHVACAMQITPVTFVSFDERQIRLARKAKLTVHTFE
jgi:predicted nucleic acid-binding protein